MKAIVMPSKIGGEISAISSKSAAHRLVIESTFSTEPTKFYCENVSEDILATVDCLRSLGSQISYENHTFTVVPKDKNSCGKLFCNESGTTLRLLLPIAAAIGGEWTFDMRGKLPARPLYPLQEDLVSHGITFQYLASNKLKINGKLSCGNYAISGNISSQFISGLLFALTLVEGESTLEITGKIESAPYISMTVDTLKSFGAKIEQAENIFKIEGANLSSKGKCCVEGDWSNSAFSLCAAAISKSEVTLKNITTGEEYALDYQLSERQRDIILAGSLLDYTRENS